MGSAGDIPIAQLLVMNEDDDFYLDIGITIYENFLCVGNFEWFQEDQGSKFRCFDMHTIDMDEVRKEVEFCYLRAYHRWARNHELEKTEALLCKPEDENV